VGHQAPCHVPEIKRKGFPDLFKLDSAFYH